MVVTCTVTDKNPYSHIRRKLFLLEINFKHWNYNVWVGLRTLNSKSSADSL
jgi:hypothetical protein